MADQKGAEIRRMACHKVAVEAVGAIPTKGISDAWRMRFREVADFLEADVIEAGRREIGLDAKPQPATIDASANGETGPQDPGVTIEQALELETFIKTECGEDEALKSAVKLQFVKFGVKNPKDLLSAVGQLTVSQADEMKNYIKSEK